jgi:hypothetical protein
MQIKDRLEKLSRLRQALRRCMADMESSLDVTFGRASMVKGNVYELARKCGKPTCACARGAFHRNMVLSWSHEGKTKLFSIPQERLSEMREKSEEYLRFRHARAQVSVICKKVLGIMDRIEKLRREEP